jgi:hypothetical protein
LFENRAEEINQLLVTLRLGVLDVGLQGLDVVGGGVEVRSRYVYVTDLEALERASG